MLVIIVTLIIVGLDQLTKLWALGLKGKDNIIIIKDLLEFTYLENRGAAFGILQGRSLLFILITLVVVGYILYFLHKHKNLSFLSRLSLAMIVAGGIGNLIDRIIRGYVVDFIFVRFWGYYDFPVFNIADIGVTLGVFFLLFMTIFTDEFDGVL